MDGPILIVAGAGSGKTRVLTARIANMLEKGVKPESILALTFTKKAATEMKERIALTVGEKKARKLCMGTFHAVFVRFLREYADSLGYPSSFTIYDTSDSTSAIKSIIKAMNLDEKIYKPKSVLARISMAKNNLVTPTGYRRDTLAMTNDRSSKMPNLINIYEAYWKRCREVGVMDFDDILMNMNILLRDNPKALESISKRFSYIMVDEYQDTNFAQYLIIKKLALAHRNICVVGDDSQSIYAFRGAKIENILNFKKDFPDAKTFKLVLNYRSTRMIVGAANSLIERNEGRIPKECKAASGEDGDKIRLVKAYTELEEAVLVADKIIDIISRDKAKYCDFALLYRTNAQSRALEEALRKRNLPYQIFSGNAFFDRMEVKDAMSYFKLVANPNDDEAFKRVVNKPARGIGDTSVTSLENAAKQMKTSLFKAALSPQIEMYLKSAALFKIRQFCQMIDLYSSRSLSEDAYMLASDVINKSGLYAVFKMDDSVESQARAANIEELLNSVKQYVEDREAEIASESESEDGIPSGNMNVTLGEYLENTSLLSNVDISEDGEEANNKVVLMTVHSSKGLEFRYVFITGMEENLFPSGGMYLSPAELEEERRLFYVALTRAKMKVFLTFTETRMRNGKHESNRPSRFIKEINPFYLLNPLTKEDYESEKEYDPIELALRNHELRTQKQKWSGAGGGSTVKFTPRSSGSVTTTPKPAAPVQGQSETKYLRNQKTGSYIPVTVSSGVKPSANFVAEKDLSTFKVGDRIVHDRFGSGEIKSLEGQLPDVKAVIAFDKFGSKIILLKFAKIKHE